MNSDIWQVPVFIVQVHYHRTVMDQKCANAIVQQVSGFADCDFMFFSERKRYPESGLKSSFWRKDLIGCCWTKIIHVFSIAFLAK